MNVNMIRGNHAITRFQASQQQNDARRQQEEASFRQRFQDDQARGVDAAVRGGIGAMYATPPAAAATAAPAGAPATAPAAQDQTLPHFPQTGGDDVIMPGAVATANAMPAVGSSPAIANVTAAPAPTPTPAPARTAASSYGPLMNKLATTPGAGSTMMAMHKESQAADQRKMSAEIQAMKAMNDGDPNIAEAIARQYGLNMPPEFFRDARFRREMKDIGGYIKANGINDDNAVMQINRQYLEARKQGLDQRAAVEAAFAGVTAATKTDKPIYDQNRGGFVTPPTTANPNGQFLAPPNTPPRQFRPPSAGGGGPAGERNTALMRNAQFIANSMFGGDLSKGIAYLRQGQGQTREAWIQNTARDLAKSDPRMAREPNLAAQRATQLWDSIAAQPGGQPAPGRGAGAGAPPRTNSKGWTLHQDAQGNKAYVGPNGQIEEVQ